MLINVGLPPSGPPPWTIHQAHRLVSRRSPGATASRTLAAGAAAPVAPRTHDPSPDIGGRHAASEVPDSCGQLRLHTASTGHAPEGTRTAKWRATDSPTPLNYRERQPAVPAATGTRGSPPTLTGTDKRARRHSYNFTRRSRIAGVSDEATHRSSQNARLDFGSRPRLRSRRLSVRWGGFRRCALTTTLVSWHPWNTDGRRRGP